MSTPASWSVLNSSSPLCAARTSRIAAEYDFYRACQKVVATDPEADWTTLASTLTRDTGMSRDHLSANLDVLALLDALPQLKALVEGTRLLDMHLLRIIVRAVNSAPLAFRFESFFHEALDEDLIALFTPSRPQQLLPKKKTIDDTITQVIRRVEEEQAAACKDPAAFLRTLPPTEEEAEPTALLYVESLPEGDIRFELTVDQATGLLINDALTQAEGNRARSMVDLILGNVQVKVTTVVYSAHDVDDAPVFHPLVGQLTAQAAADLRDMVTSTVDGDAAAAEMTDSYTPTTRIRHAINGRDWVCRWPGCSRKASSCDADHRINHADGGPTTSSNMVALCRHHHNRKTDLQLTYLLDPVTGDVYWHFPDGTYAVDLATGPLEPRQRRWVQTCEQRRTRRAEHLAEQAAHDRFEDYQRENDPATPGRYRGPPPF